MSRLSRHSGHNGSSGGTCRGFVAHQLGFGEFLSSLFSSRDLLTSHPSGKVAFRNLEPIRRAPTSEQIKHASDYPSPPGLVTGSQSGTVIPVHILVEQNVVFPMRVFLKLL